MADGPVAFAPLEAEMGIAGAGIFTNPVQSLVYINSMSPPGESKARDGRPFEVNCHVIRDPALRASGCSPEA